MDIERIIVQPIYKDDRRVGSRVWVGDVELEESDPRFRAAVCGKSWHGDTPPAVTDDDCAGIVGGTAILKRPPETTRTRSLAEQAALDRARERVAALKDRQ